MYTPYRLFWRIHVDQNHRLLTRDAYNPDPLIESYLCYMLWKTRPLVDSLSQKIGYKTWILSKTPASLVNSLDISPCRCVRTPIWAFLLLYSLKTRSQLHMRLYSNLSYWMDSVQKTAAYRWGPLITLIGAFMPIYAVFSERHYVLVFSYSL